MLPFLQMLSGPSGGSATTFDSVPEVKQPKPSTATPNKELVHKVDLLRVPHLPS